MCTQKVSTVKLLHRKVSILRSFWENLHWTEKIYTGTTGGAGDKYQVCSWLERNEKLMTIGWVQLWPTETDRRRRWRLIIQL